jgi:hypothetical protein
VSFDPFSDFDAAGYLKNSLKIKGLDGLDKENISYGSLDDPEIQKIYMTYRTQK